MDISVCMATYNGEHYIAEQVASILAQLDADDELVVVDDASRDGTVAYMESLGDARVRVARNDRNLGHVQSFAKAVSLARHQYIFMADQDDVWLEGRVAAMRNALEASGAMLVSSDSEFIDGGGKAIAPLRSGLRARDSADHLGNIVRIFKGTAAYDGCAMAFRRPCLPLLLPFPSYVESHDLWIAMAANLLGANVHLEAPTLRRRVHGRNASIVVRPLREKLWSRFVFLLSFAHIAVRTARLKLAGAL